MGRSIIGGVVGYIVLFFVMFVTCTIAYLAMGPDTAFEAGSYTVSMTWILISTVLAFIAALIGGYAAALIGRGSGAVKVLAGIILVMGAISIVIVASSATVSERRAADTPSMEAMAKAQTPLWAAAISILVGIAGALAGGSMRKEKIS